MLDLRGNPGGLLNVAVEIAERFIDSGLIVSTRGRAQGQTQALSAQGRAKWRMPLYVLVDHDSASASEILAGALQDHQRATILGTRTYGKGSVQSIFSLRSAPAGLKLTTAKFYSPLNRPYSEQGVQPDIPIAGTLRRQAGRRRLHDRATSRSSAIRSSTQSSRRQSGRPRAGSRSRGEDRSSVLGRGTGISSADPHAPRRSSVQPDQSRNELADRGRIGIKGRRERSRVPREPVSNDHRASPPILHAPDRFVRSSCIWPMEGRLPSNTLSSWQRHRAVAP